MFCPRGTVHGCGRPLKLTQTLIVAMVVESFVTSEFLEFGLG